jgi:hypothetical protein
MSQIGCPFQQRISVQEVETEIKKSKLTEKNFKKVENFKKSARAARVHSVESVQRPRMDGQKRTVNRLN